MYHGIVLSSYAVVMVIVVEAYVISVSTHLSVNSPVLNRQ